MDLEMVKNNSSFQNFSPKISILIVSYNTCNYTLECIDSILESEPDVEYEILVLDNASSDNSAAKIKQHYGKQLELIESKVNLGFAQANNELAKISKGEYLLLLNPDTIVLNKAIDSLLLFANSKKEAKIWGGRTLFGDRTLNPASCWAKQSLWALVCQASGLNSIFRNTSFFNPEGIGGWNRAGTRQVDIVSGCFLLIERPFWKDLDGFSKNFFMYGEEADLCLRAARHGAKPMVSSQATIIHYGGVSEKIRSEKLIRLLKAKALLGFDKIGKK